MVQAPIQLKRCRLCGSPALDPVLDLGEQSLTGRFPKDPEESLTRGPLCLVKCGASCGLVQLAHDFELSELYGADYGYRSGLNASMVRHLAAKVEWLTERVPLRPGDVVLDIGSNDGTTLSFYPDSLNRIGIDPTTEKFRRFHPPGIEATAEFFSADAFRRVAGARKAKIVTSISMFYDLPAPLEFAKQVAAIIEDGGVWHLEQSYLPAMLRSGSYDTVCHEHLEYYSLSQIQWIAQRSGFFITDVQMNDVNGGSFAVTLRKGCGAEPARVQEILIGERFLDSNETWLKFQSDVSRHREELVRTLQLLRAHGSSVFGLGASTKGNVILQYCGIDSELVTAIAEVNPDKFGCYTPSTRIPICSEADALAAMPDVFLVLPWHFRQPILQRHQTFLSGGGRMLFPLPRVELVSAR